MPRVNPPVNRMRRLLTGFVSDKVNGKVYPKGLPSLFGRRKRRNTGGYGTTAVILEILLYSLDVCPCLLIGRDTIVSKNRFLPGIIGG